VAVKSKGKNQTAVMKCTPVLKLNPNARHHVILSFTRLE